VSGVQSGIEERLAGIIARKRDALIEDLRLHVGLPTGGFNYGAIEQTRELLVSRLIALGASHRLVPGDPKPSWLLGSDPSSPIPQTSVCARLRPGLPSVLIAGHMDTVHDPRSSFRELSIAPGGMTATGPGCVDMKGGLVIAVAALEALEEAGVSVSWSFLLNCDEETGSYHSETAISEQATLHNWGIALEPALPDGSLVVERMGSGQFMIEARGRSAHVGRAFTEGVSAVTALAKAMVAVGEMPDPARGRIFNVAVLEGGAATNAVPDLARAWGNARFPDQASADEMATQLMGVQTADDALPSVRVFTSFNRPAKTLTPEVKQLAMAARRVAEDLGQKLPFGKTGGVCDGNIMQAAGLPTIDTLGVRGGGLHTTDEWIEMASLVERCQLLAILLARIASGEAPGEPMDTK